MTGRYRCARCQFQSEDPAEIDGHTRPVDDEGAGHPACTLCGTSLEHHERRVCTPCVGNARATLLAITDQYALLPASLNRLGSNAPRDGRRSRELPLPGGDPLVMLSAGSWGLSETPDTTRDDDPPPVAFELRRWETEWRRIRGEPPNADEDTPTVTGVVAYLMPRTGWAADNRDNFPAYTRHLDDLAKRLTRANGTGEARDEGEAHCLRDECHQVRLRKKWGTTEDQDRWECPRCQRTYTRAMYNIALAATLQDAQEA